MKNENNENRTFARSQLRIREDESSELAELGELCKAVADPTPERAKAIMAAKTTEIIKSESESKKQ